MPYINDVLENNERVNREAKPASTKGRPSRFRFDPDEVIDLLKARIIGQPGMLEAVGDMLHVVKADFGASGRPLAVFLLVGSTGVGKTETVRVIAEAILGSAEQICRIDMNTLAQEHYSAAITGAPPGYVGSKENHSLFSFDKVEGSFSRPGIVLFDEVEKASNQVARALLNVLDSGVLELSSGNRRLSFENSLIFMTSNEGARNLDRFRRKFESGWRSRLKLRAPKDKEKKILEKALHGKFDLEFINRIDRIVHFEELDSRHLDGILEVEISMLERRLAKHGVSLRIDRAARDFLINDHDPRFGARHLRRRLQVHLEPVLARALNAATCRDVLVVRCPSGTLVAEAE